MVSATLASDISRNWSVALLPRMSSPRLAVRIDPIIWRRNTASKASAACFSCSRNERAWEHPELSHGVFFYHILQGLQHAVRDEEEKVTFEALTTYVRQKVPTDTKRLLRRKQTPTGAWRSVSVVKKREPTSHAGKFMSDAATAYAVLALSH